MLIDNPLETARLILRPEVESDADLIYRMNTDPEVMRFTADGQPWTSPIEQFREQVRQNLAKLANEKYGSATVCLKTCQFIGACWLAPSKHLKDMELGYRYIRTAWGHGYATEAARAVLRVGFERIGAERFAAMVHPRNTASIRVLEKLSFSPVGEVFHDRYGCNVPHYLLERAAFRMKDPL